MALPGNKITFANGSLGVVATSPDGICSIVASATANGNFLLNKHYVVFSLKAAELLGILPTVDNYELHKTIKEFYQEAGDGTELWIYGVAKTRTLDQLVDDSKALLTASNRRVKFVICKYAPSVAETTTTAGLRTGFASTIATAQTIADNYTVDNIHPVVFVLEGYNFTGVAQDLGGFALDTNNRVMVMIGDTETRTGTTASKGAAVGILAGRIAKNQVHINIGRVKTGALKPLDFYIKDTRVEQYNVATLHGKGFVTLRTHVGKANYFFTDDPLACTVEDDYHYLTHRRVIDKAFVLANATLTDFILDTVPVTNEGKIDPNYAKAVEAEIVRVIAQEMTTKGELSADVTKNGDTGVEAKIDLNAVIITTSKLIGAIRVRPHGYNRFIEFNIGFAINN